MNTKLPLITLLLFFPLSVFAQDRLLIGYGGFSGVHVPIWVTKEFGLLEKYQLKGDLVMIPGGSRQMQALIGGSIQSSHIDSTAPITAIHRGAELVIVAGALNKFPFSIVTQKEIRQPSDLIGKRIGIVNFGGSKRAVRGPRSQRMENTKGSGQHYSERTVRQQAGRAFHESTRCNPLVPAPDNDGGKTRSSNFGPTE